MILDERGFDTFVSWAERAKEFLRAYGNPPSPTNEDDWRHWGSELGLLPGFPNFPSPYQYDDWREWVQALNRTVQVT